MRSDNNGVIGLRSFHPLVIAPAFPEKAVAYSCINYIDRAFSPLNSMFRSIPPFCTFCYFKCRCSRASQSTVLRVMIMCGFVQVKFCLPLFTLRIFFYNPRFPHSALHKLFPRTRLRTPHIPPNLV